MLVISLEGTYELERDARGCLVERPCRLGRRTATAEPGFGLQNVPTC